MNSNYNAKYRARNREKLRLKQVEIRKQLKIKYKDLKCKTCNSEITYTSRLGLCRKCNNTAMSRRPHIRKMMSEIHLAEKNPMWAGDNVGRQAVHNWVHGRLPKTELCNICKKVPPIDLANISSTYDKKTYTRNLKNWEWLCRKCHMTKDGRIKKLIEQGIENCRVYALQKRRKIIQKNIDGSIENEYESIASAGRHLGINPKNIDNALKRKHRTVGYFWEYKK